MARGMTKATCLTFEKLATTEISKVLGEPGNYAGTGAYEWQFPYGETGVVSLVLWRDSEDVGNVYRSSWIAGRLSDPSFVDEDGYTKPRNQIDWPYQFTYPSGKYNLHPGNKDDIEQMRRDLAHYLYSIAAPDSREKLAFGDIEFEVKN